LHCRAHTSIIDLILTFALLLLLFHLTPFLSHFHFHPIARAFTQASTIEFLWAVVQWSLLRRILLIKAFLGNFKNEIQTVSYFSV